MIPDSNDDGSASRHPAGDAARNQKKGTGAFLRGFGRKRGTAPLVTQGQ